MTRKIIDTTGTDSKLDIPPAPQLPVPEQCSKCDGTRFRQVGDIFVCKGCGTENKSPGSSDLTAKFPPLPSKGFDM